MQIVDSSFEILRVTDNPLKLLEQAGRVCYKSEGRITLDSAGPFVRKIVQRGHESVLEHASVTVRLVFNRAICMEQLRHRIASYSNESTRYCNYEQKGLTFIRTRFQKDSLALRLVWRGLMKTSELGYLALLRLGARFEEARDVLPHALRSELIVTANFREWKHIFELRTSPQAHPQMRELMGRVQESFAKICPEVFECSTT